MTKSADANNQERSNSLHILLSPLGDHFALDDQKPEQKMFSQKEQHVVGYWLCNIIQQPSKQRWARRDLNCNTRKSTDTTRSPSFSHRCRSEHQRGVMWLASHFGLVSFPTPYSNPIVSSSVPLHVKTWYTTK